MWCIHITEYHSALKNKENLPFDVLYNIVSILNNMVSYTSEFVEMVDFMLSVLAINK